jgi:uncharacterized membrane protein
MSTPWFVTRWCQKTISNTLLHGKNLTPSPSGFAAGLFHSVLVLFFDYCYQWFHSSWILIETSLLLLLFGCLDGNIWIYLIYTVHCLYKSTVSITWLSQAVHHCQAMIVGVFSTRNTCAEHRTLLFVACFVQNKNWNHQYIKKNSFT